MHHNNKRTTTGSDQDLGDTIMHSPRSLPGSPARTKYSYPWPAAVAAAVLAGLLLYPATSWLVRTQLGVPDFAPRSFAWVLNDIGIQASHIGAADVAGQYHLMEKEAQQHPDDVQLQMGKEDRLSDMKALVPRFPASPALYATVLRMDTRGEIALHRPEAQGSQNNPGDPLRHSAPGALAEYDRIAEAGERMDPDNAYFPLMRAVGLFEQQRDTEAIQAILRAGRMSHWNDYANESAEGRWRLFQAVTGNQSSLARTGLYAAVLLPHFAQMRALARIVVVRAHAAETSGRVGEGIALQLALMHCGDLMRAQSRNLIGSLVGIAITRLAATAAGRKQEDAHRARGLKGMLDDQAHRDKLARIREAQWVGYLKRAGYAPEAQESAAILAAARQTSDLVQGGLSLTPFAGGLTLQVTLWWMAGIVVIANTLWMVVLGGAAVLRSHARRGQGNERGTLALLLVLGAGMAVALVLWQAQWSSVMDALLRACMSMETGADPVDRSVLVPAVLFGLTPLVPCLVLATFWIRSLVRREPVSIGIVRGLRASAAPVVCFLVIFYAVLIGGTVRVESQLNGDLSQDEGRYTADLTHVHWPEAVGMQR